NNNKSHSSLTLFHDVIHEMWWGWKNVPDILLRCIYVQFFAFIGFYCMWIYLADFYGRYIYNGRPRAKEHTKDFNRYVRGISAANYAYVAMSVIEAIFSLLLIPLTKRFGIKPVWGGCLAIAGVSLSVTPVLIGSPVGIAIIVNSFIGFGLCVSFSLPWSIVTKYSLLYDQNRGGLWTTIFNSSECLAEIFVSLIAGNFVNIFEHSTAIIMIIGGFSLLVASLLVLRVKDDLSSFEYQQIHHGQNKHQTTDNL
ncbi:transporter, major facilitator family, partial [Reticulomyxa filosa]